MNDRKVIEIYKSVHAVEQSQPHPFTPQDVAYIQRLIEDGLSKAKANPQNRETHTLAEIIAVIENDKNKSETKKDFEIYIASIADRISYIDPRDGKRKSYLTDPPEPPTENIEGSQAETKNSDSSLRQMIRTLQKRLH